MNNNIVFSYTGSIANISTSKSFPLYQKTNGNRKIKRIKKMQ